MKTIASLSIRPVLAAACLLPALAGAEIRVNSPGVELVPPAANTGAVAPSAQASTAREVNKNPGQTLRCWQQGRLLYERPGFKEQAVRQPNAVVVPRQDGEQVVIYDNRDSVCILSEK